MEQLSKYSWEKIEDNKSYVWHTENVGTGSEVKTLIAVTDNAEKAHFLATAANQFIESTPIEGITEQKLNEYAITSYDVLRKVLHALQNSNLKGTILHQEISAAVKIGNELKIKVKPYGK